MLANTLILCTLLSPFPPFQPHGQSAGRWTEAQACYEQGLQRGGTSGLEGGSRTLGGGGNNNTNRAGGGGGVFPDDDEAAEDEGGAAGVGDSVAVNTPVPYHTGLLTCLQVFPHFRVFPRFVFERPGHL